MVIAVPTGIKIFSWLSYSLSKNNMANTIKYFTTLSLQGEAKKTKDNDYFKERLYESATPPRANRKYIKENNSIKDLVPFGSNLSSTVNYPTYNIIIQHMVILPSNIKNIIIGLLLSDGWMQKQISGGHARLFFKQSLNRRPGAEYLFYVFIILQHYCKSYPNLEYAKFKGKNFPFLVFTTRSLVCLTELYNLFYKEGKKVLPYNILELLTIEGLAHWICGDGSFVKGGGLYLNTQSFTLIENELLIKVLNIKFNCKCSIHMQRGLRMLNRSRRSIYISARSMKNLTPLLIPYFPKSMLYKLIKVNI
jgi:hypothetical protein